jgi:hypothetical protein
MRYHRRPAIHAYGRADKGIDADLRRHDEVAAGRESASTRTGIWMILIRKILFAFICVHLRFQFLFGSTSLFMGTLRTQTTLGELSLVESLDTPDSRRNRIRISTRPGRSAIAWRRISSNVSGET